MVKSVYIMHLNKEPAENTTEFEIIQTDDVSVPRPETLAEFNGQTAIKDIIAISIASAVKRGAPMDHVLFFGPPGVGKTTLAKVIATELNAGFKVISAPSMKHPSDLVSALSTVEDNDVLFIDEIHRLPVALEEILYTAMEDYCLDLVVGEGASSKILRVPLPPFTLIGATTRQGSLSQPLRDRFGLNLRLQLYTDAELMLVIERAVSKLGLKVEANAISMIASRSRGTPRIALKLLNRVRDHYIAKDLEAITSTVAEAAIEQSGVDANGLDENERQYLSTLQVRFKGGPVGLKSLSMAMAESEETIENAIEPYLIRKAFMERTPRGRVITQAGVQALA